MDKGLSLTHTDSQQIRRTMQKWLNHKLDNTEQVSQNFLRWWWLQEGDYEEVDPLQT